jgi:Tol biopolymer transport system component
MTTNEQFERGLTAWLHDDAAFRVPDHLDEVLQATRSTGQRPAWSSLERWLPVDTTFRPRLFDTPSAGRVLAVAALILILVSVAVFAIGSQHRLPPPFGLARNGTYVESRDGDLYTIDPATAETLPLISGPAYDFGGSFSRDGTKMAFLRSDTGRPSDKAGVDVFLTLYVANADGSDARAVTAPTKNMDWLDWSPDSTRMAYVSNKDLYVVDLATGDTRHLNGTGPLHYATWLPPDGREIIYRTVDTQSPAIFAIPADGSGGPRKITRLPAINEYDFQSLAVAPDGKHIAFTRWGADGPHIHSVDIATGAFIDYPTSGSGERDASFSPDGSLIAYGRLGPGDDLQMAIANADGSGGERVIGPVAHGTADGPIPANWVFTPDGKALIVRFGDDHRGTMHLVPLDGSESRTIETGGFQFIDVQRLAP